MAFALLRPWSSMIFVPHGSMELDPTVAGALMVDDGAEEVSWFPWLLSGWEWSWLWICRGAGWWGCTHDLSWSQQKAFTWSSHSSEGSKCVKRRDLTIGKLGQKSHQAHPSSMIQRVQGLGSSLTRMARVKEIPTTSMTQIWRAPTWSTAKLNKCLQLERSQCEQSHDSLKASLPGVVSLKLGSTRQG